MANWDKDQLQWLAEGLSPDMIARYDSDEIEEALQPIRKVSIVYKILDILLRSCTEEA